MPGNCDVRETKASIVVVGSLNPLIFQPHWLAKNNFISEHEAEAAEVKGVGVEIIHREAVILQFERLRLQVTPDRISIDAAEPPLVVAKDFISKCFTLLGHTPVSQMGVNFETVFQARTRADWDALGDAIAPKEPWKALLGDFDPKERTGGLVHQTMERSERDDGRPGKVVVFVRALEPRAKMTTSVLVNNHFDFGADASGAEIVETLEACFEADEAFAKTVVASLMDLTHAG